MLCFSFAIQSIEAKVPAKLGDGVLRRSVSQVTLMAQGHQFRSDLVMWWKEYAPCYVYQDLLVIDEHCVF